VAIGNGLIGGKAGGNRGGENHGISPEPKILKFVVVESLEGSMGW